MTIAPERTIEGLRFVLTSDRSPEQYDVFQGDKQVGNVRLRWGFFRVDLGECGGERLLESGEEDDIGDGDFDTEELRAVWLTRAAQAIKARL